MSEIFRRALRANRERTEHLIKTLPVFYDRLKPHDKRNVREAYAKKQGGLCQHCGSSLERMPSAKLRATKVDKGLFPEGFFDHPVHLHHCHDTGLTIGAVHNWCNAVLWQHHGE